MKYIIKYLLISCVLLSIITLYLLGWTREGLMLDILYIQRLVPGEIKVGQVEGALFSDFSLQKISYQYAGQRITIEAINVHWSPSKLLTKKLVFNTLSIKNADIQLNDNSLESHSTFDSKALQTQLKYLQLISFKQFNIENVSIHKGDQLITLQGTLTDHWNVQWKFNLPDINAWISDAKGSLQGSGSISGSRETPAINAVFNGKQFAYQNQKISTIHAEANILLQPGHNSTLKLNASGMKLYDYDFNKFDLNIIGMLKYINKDLTTTLQLNASNNFKLNLFLTLPKFAGFNYPHQAINGNALFSAPDLSILAKLIPDIKDPRGLLNGSITLRGTFKQPTFSSHLTLKNGSFALPATGINPNNINAQGQLDNSLNLTFNGTFTSGSGTGRLQGACDLTKPEFPLTLAVQGNNLQIINLSEYKAAASTTDFHLLFAYPALQLNGKVTIPSADIMPKKISGAVTLPDEVVFIDKTKPAEIATSSPIQLSVQLGLQLGDKVNVDYDNLTAKLLGDLTISKIPDSPATASGELYTLEGKYTAYGQKLTIDTGRLIYTGNTLTNPGLNIRAIKKVRRVVTQNVSSFTDNSAFNTVDTEMLSVGVQVSGTADNPRVSLISIPADLSQGDILSYLLLGLPQSQASGAQGSALLTALSAYNPNATTALGLTNKLQQTFGLNELNVESVETFNPNTQAVESNTSFVVGKQITRKLSIHYSIGLFNPVSVLNLRYQMSKHWAIQSETSTIDSGADLLYGFERD